MRWSPRAGHGQEHVCDQCLHPEIQSATAEAAEGAYEVDNAYIGLLKVANETDAQAGQHAEPQGETIMTQHGRVQIRMVFKQLQDVSVTHVYCYTHWNDKGREIQFK